MSDPNKYINYYVEHSLSMVHEYINTLLQTKTQLRVVQEQLSEKDTVIASLQNELNSRATSEEELNRAKAQATSWEDSVNSMKQKVAHMDTLSNQIGEAKKMLVDKTHEIDNLKIDIVSLKKQVSDKDSQIRELKKLVPADALPKKVLNTKKKSTGVIEEVKAVEKVEEKPPIVPYKPLPEGTKPKLVPFVPPGEKAEHMVPLKVVNVVEEPEEKTDDF